MPFVVDPVLAKTGVQQALLLAASWHSSKWTGYNYVAAGFPNATAMVKRQIFPPPPAACPKALFEQFCKSSQDRSYGLSLTPAVAAAIGTTALFGYDYSLIVANYPDVASLKRTLLAAGIKPRIAADRFAETIYEGARKFHGYAPLPTMSLAKAHANILGPIVSITAGHVTIDDVMETIARFESVPNMGLPLISNFLKDSGLPHFVKPDIHLLDIVGDIFAAPPGRQLKSNPVGTWCVLHSVIIYAQAAGIDPAALDRLLWLTGSGLFHILPKPHRLPASSKRARIAHVSRLLRPAILSYSF